MLGIQTMSWKPIRTVEGLTVTGHSSTNWRPLRMCSMLGNLTGSDVLVLVHPSSLGATIRVVQARESLPLSSLLCLPSISWKQTNSNGKLYCLQQWVTIYSGLYGSLFCFIPFLIMTKDNLFKEPLPLCRVLTTHFPTASTSVSWQDTFE